MKKIGADWRCWANKRRSIQPTHITQPRHARYGDERIPAFSIADGRGNLYEERSLTKQDRFCPLNVRVDKPELSNFFWT